MVCWLEERERWPIPKQEEQASRKGLLNYFSTIVSLFTKFVICIFQAADAKNGEAKENTTIKVSRGAVIKLTNLPEKVDRDEIKKSFVPYEADVAHVDGPSDKVAYVRFRAENEGKTVRFNWSVT